MDSLFMNVMVLYSGLCSPGAGEEFPVQELHKLGLVVILSI